jgi:hypothetical protein
MVVVASFLVLEVEAWRVWAEVLAAQVSKVPLVAVFRALEVWVLLEDRLLVHLVEVFLVRTQLMSQKPQ